MKLQLMTKYARLGSAALALGLFANTVWAASDIVVGPSGTQSGTSGAAPDFEWQNMWGPAFTSITFDAANPPPTGDTAGSIYIQGNWTAPAQDNYCIGSPGNWWGAVTFDASQYASIEMDIKYDTNSTIVPTSQAHLDIGFDAGYNKITITNGMSFNVASQAIANGAWHHLSIPIPSSITGAGAVHSVAFYQWNPSATGTMNFWVANVTVLARVLPTPPPTVKAPAKAAAGLNVIYGTPGAYDRHEARLQADTGKMWVGNATAGNPVTYSFTINSFPPTADANVSGCEAYLFLIPNPAYHDNAPDWNETNCVVAFIQQGLTNAVMHLQYKVNLDHQNAMYGGGSYGYTIISGAVTNVYTTYYNQPVGSMPGGPTTNVVAIDAFNNAIAITNETGNLGSVTNTATSPKGTWAVKFTSDTTGTLMAPDGSTSSFTIPSYNAQFFAEAAGATTNSADVYLGGQPNNAVVFNDAVVYSAFSVTGTPNPFSENFLTETSLNSSNWDVSMSSAPGPVVVPVSAAYWVNWTLPASGFSLQAGTNLTSLSAWSSPSMGPILSLNGINSQLVDSSEVPAGNTVFFNLIKRTFTQLQVLFPGQTNAPGTLLGYTGSPTPISLATQGFSPSTVTVNAVDATFHIINGVVDQVHLTTSDGSAYLPADMAMVNGTASFTGANGVLFQTTGSQTVTATDTTNTNIPAATSAPITITP